MQNAICHVTYKRCSLFLYLLPGGINYISFILHHAMTSKYHQQWQTIANFKYDSSYSNFDILHCLTCCEVDGGWSEIVGNSLPWGSSVSGAASVAWVPSPGMRLISVPLLIVWKKTWSINIMFIITWPYLLWIFFKEYVMMIHEVCETALVLMWG